MLIIDPTDSDWWGLCHKHLLGVPLSLWHRVTTPNSRSHPTKSNSPHKTVLEPSTSDLHIYPYVNVATNNQFHCQPTRQILTILNLLKSVISTLLCRVISTCRGLWSLVIRSFSSQTISLSGILLLLTLCHYFIWWCQGQLLPGNWLVVAW